MCMHEVHVSPLHDQWTAVMCQRSARAVNGSHDVTFSLDYRRLDDGSPPGYSNNRWANRQVGGSNVHCVCDPPFCHQKAVTHIGSDHDSAVFLWGCHYLRVFCPSVCDDSAQQRNTSSNRKRAIPNQVGCSTQLSPVHQSQVLAPPISS